MSGKVLSYSPQSKTYVPRAPNGKYAPAGPLKIAGEGVIQNAPVKVPGPVVLSQHPMAVNDAGPTIVR